MIREWARRAVSFPVLLGALVAGATYAMVRPFNVDPDFWWHLKTGELILATHHWPTADPYSFTAARAPWMAAEWLGDVLFALVWRLGGLRGLEALLIALASLVTLSLYRLATLRSGSAKAGVIAVAALLGLINVSFTLRPQMIGYLFVVLTLIALERFRQGRQRTVWLLPFLLLIWINTHGSWPIGLGTIAVFLASGLVSPPFEGLDVRRWTSSERVRLETVLMLCVVVIPITPYGTGLAQYPFTVASSLPISITNISEWQPMPFQNPIGKVFLVLFFGFLFVQLAFRFRWRLDEILLFLFGAAMACLHVRFLLLFIPFFAPLLATTLARWTSGRDDDVGIGHLLINFGLMAAIAVAMVRWFPSRAEMAATVANQFPVAAVEYLRRHPAPGRLFNAYDFGGYMIWSGHEVFIDGRSELFEVTGVLDDYGHIVRLRPGAMKVLGSYGIRSCLLHARDPLATLLASQPGWHKVYSDNLSALYVKRDAEATRDAP